MLEADVRSEPTQPNAEPNADPNGGGNRPLWPAVRKRLMKAVKAAVVGFHRRRGKVLISDTTLRDGEQMPRVRFSAADKLRIALALEEAGVHSIDAGFAACAESEVEAIQGLVGKVKRAVLTSLCRTLPGDVDAADRALAGQPMHKRGVSLFVGISPQHRQYKHQKSKSEILDLIGKSTEYASRKFQIIAFGPEDASRTEPDFLCRCYQEAIDAGATTIGFSDTVGLMTPEKCRDFIRRIQDGVPNISRALLAVHYHNDLGLATANSLASVAEGANIVQGTLGGIGERAGNAALEEVVLALHLHPEQYRRSSTVDPKRLLELCRLTYELAGLPISPNKPIAGANIFATEAGVHQDGLLKNPETYLPYPPETVGAEGFRLVIGKHSGRRAVSHRLSQLGVTVTDAQADRILQAVKRLPNESSADDDSVLRGLAEETLRQDPS